MAGNNILAALAALASPSNVGAVLTEVTGALSGAGSVAAKAQPLLSQLALVTGTPAAANIITQIESLPNVPPQALALLEKLRTVTDPLQVQQYIVAIEQLLQGASDNLLTALQRTGAALQKSSS